MINDDASSQHSTKKKSFLIKKKFPEDSSKMARNLQSLPGGLSNYYMAPVTSNNASFKPASRDDRNRSKYLNTSTSQKLVKPLDNFEHSEQPLTEIGERSQVEEEERKNLIEGPQLKMKKEYISFLVETESVGYDNVVVWNNGSAAIYYEWKRIDSVREQSNSIQDVNEERFFCHHDQNVIKPGERIRFVFSFLSKLTGVFNEEWQLKCEPPCLQSVPTLKLSGTAYIDDDYNQKRKDFEIEIKQKFSLKIATEIVGDIFEEVKTPPPPHPNLEDPEHFKIEFEELNLNEQMWFTRETMNLFKFTLQEIQEQLNQQHDWNADVKQLRQLIQHIDDEEEKELVQRKLDLWCKIAKKTPITRNPLYPVVFDLLGGVVSQIASNSEELRRELQMWDYVFKEPEDMTPEQQKQKNDEYTKMKAEWLKKAKKKKWNEELEKELVDEYRGKLGERVGNLLGEAAICIENDGALLSVGAMMNPALKWDTFRRRRFNEQYWEQLLRKKTIGDSEIEGKKVGLRLHLQLSDKPDVMQLKAQFENQLLVEQEEENKRLEEERLEKERLAQEMAKKKGKGKPQQKQKEKEEEVIQQKPKVRDLSHLDHKILEESVEVLKILLERQAKLIILLVSYDSPSGKYNFTSSTKFYYEWLQTKLDCPVYFSETIIENLDELLENQTYQENAVLVLENLFFHEDETGYIEEPDIEDKTIYRTLLPYGQIYVIGDRINFFTKFYPSIIHLKADQVILSNTIAKDIHIMAHNLNSCSNATILIGGELTGDKLLAIDQLSGHVKSIILMGKLGLAFYLTMYEIQSNLINDSVRNVIKNLLNTLKDESTDKPPQRLTRISHLSQQPKPKSRLICPQDFLITQIPQEYDPANQEHVLIITSSVTPYVPEGSIVLEEGWTLLDYGPKTIEIVTQEIHEAQRLIWIDDANLALKKIEKTITVPDFEAIALLKKLKEEEAIREQERLEKLKEKKGTKAKKQVKEEVVKEEINIKTTKEINVPVFNLTNKALGTVIYEMNLQKKERHQHAHKSGNLNGYEFNQDCITTIIGENLEKELNQEDFEKKEEEIQQEQVIEQDQEQEQEIEQAVEPSQKGSQFQSEQQDENDKLDIQEEKVKINQVRQLLADFYIQDQEFILKLLAGNQCHIQLEEYPPKPESEINEEQYFEDDGTP